MKLINTRPKKMAKIRFSPRNPTISRYFNIEPHPQEKVEHSTFIRYKVVNGKFLAVSRSSKSKSARATVAFNVRALLNNFVNHNVTSPRICNLFDKIV